MKFGEGREEGREFNEPWRRESWRNMGLIVSGWKRVEASGEAEVRRWLEGVETEKEWAGVMRRLAEWEKVRRTEEGIELASDVYWWLSLY